MGLAAWHQKWGCLYGLRVVDSGLLRSVLQRDGGGH